MMSLIRNINPKRYTYRTYIITSGDSFSAGKAYEIEKIIQSKHHNIPTEPTKADEFDPETGVWCCKVVPRARRIHQPLYTTPFSCLLCFIGCIRALYKTSQKSKAISFEYPDVIITNGPATAVLVILAATALKFFAMAPVWKMKTLYVESWARVKTLSLSGKMILWFGICDMFLVQWESLAQAINGNAARKKVEWVGFLVE